MFLWLNRRTTSNAYSVSGSTGVSNGGFFSGEYYPDKIGRMLMLVRNNGRLEGHLVPASEDHALCAQACDCGVKAASWGSQSIFYHKSEITKVVIPTHMPVQV